MDELTPLNITAFNVGDIIVNKIIDDSCIVNIHEYIYSIKSIDYLNYTYNIEQVDNGQTQDITCDHIHRHYRLWCITDAYDGDILYNKNDNIYVIYNSTWNNYSTIWVNGSYIIDTQQLVLTMYEEGHDVQGYKIVSFGERQEFDTYISKLGYEYNYTTNDFVKLENSDRHMPEETKYGTGDFIMPEETKNDDKLISTKKVSVILYEDGTELVNKNNGNIKIKIENAIKIPELNKYNYMVVLYENSIFKDYYQLDIDYVHNEYKPIYDKFTLKLQKILDEYRKSNKIWDEFCYEYGKKLKELINEDK